MGIARKFMRSLDKAQMNISDDSVALACRIVRTVAAVGFAMTPFVAEAANPGIVKVSGKEYLDGNDKVANIYADSVLDAKFAYNAFNKFNVDAGKIANMYFKTETGSTEASNLLNFVYDRINVNGTVNAVQNSKIGGNLIFLSKDGMAIGKSGAINAGSLTVLTPTESYMDKFKLNDAAVIPGVILGEVDNIQAMNVPINKSGSISIQGKINTTGDIRLKAAQIDVAIYDENTNAAEKGNAILQTGVVDFKNLVNIGDVSANLGADLQVERNGNGDIVLFAENRYNDNYSATDTFTDANGETVTAVVNIGQNAKFVAEGDVQIKASATNNVVKELADTDYSDGVTNGHLFGQIVHTKAEVNIDGSITANKQADSGGFIDIDAEAKNIYVSADNSILSGGSGLNLIGMLAANEAIAYAVLQNEANVNIQKNAVLKATASDVAANEDANIEAKRALSIVADAGLEAAVGASTTLVSVKNISITSNIPSAAVTYTETTNKANVVVEGTLISADGAEIKALADSMVESAALNTSFKLADNPEVINAAINVVDSENSSYIEIKDTANLVKTTSDSVTSNNLLGALDIVAHSTNELISKSEVTAADTSIAATAVNVTNYDSKADVIIDAPLKAKSVNIAALNDVKENTVTADNAAGSSFLVAKASGALKNTQTFNEVIGSTKQAFIKGILECKNTPDFVKNKLTDESGPTVTILDKIGELISVGASVGIADVNHNAKVLLTENAVVTADESLSIEAKGIIHDTLMYATGATSNYAERLNNQENAKVLVNASVFYAEVDNNASVVVEGGDAHTKENAEYVQLIGKNVSVNAEARFKYGRVNKMIADLKEMCDQVVAAYDKLDSTEGRKQIRDKFVKIKEEADSLDKKLEANDNYEGTADGFSNLYADIVTFCDVVGEVLTLLGDANSEVLEPIKDMAVGSLSVVGAATKFASPYNYVTFNAGSSSGGRSDDQGASVSVAGSANVNYLTNNANVLIGKNAVIKADDKVNIGAIVESKDVVLNGKVGLNSGGDTAVTGGVVGVHFTDANSIVAIAESVKIEGQQIDIGAGNDVLNTAITFGGAKSNGVGVQGMVNYMSGDSNSIVSIDDEASLNATKGADSQEEKAGLLNVHTENNTSIVAVTGGFALGSAGGVGVALGISEFDRNNFAAIADNDAIVVNATSDEAEDDAVINLKNLIKEKSGLINGEDESAYNALFGSKDTKVDGQITVGKLAIEAKTDGFFTNVAADAGITTGSDENKPGISDKLDKFLGNTGNSIQNKINSLDNTLTKKVLKQDPNVYMSLPTNQEASNPKAGQKLPSFSLTGAGSGAVNTLEGATAAIIDSAKITFNENSDATLNVKAKDDSMLVATAGGAAITYKGYTTAQNQSNKTATLTGAVGVNITDTDVLALVRNSEIKEAKSIINNAQRGGTAVAAGLGVGAAVHASGGGNSANVTAAVSVNLLDETVRAHMLDNTVSNEHDIKTAVTNVATNNNLQITGGVNTNFNFGGKSSVAVGGTVNWAIVDNEVEAKINGGTYDGLDTVDVKAITDMTQINAAVGIGVTTAKGANFQGNVAYSKLNNQVNATVENLTMVADKLNVDAYDENLDANKHAEYLKNRNFDTTGEVYVNSAKDNADNNNISDSGNLVVTVALEVGASADGGGTTTAVGASVAINDVDNDFRANVDKATITLNGTSIEQDTLSDLVVNAESSTLLVNTAVGANGTSKGISGAGSFAWNTLNNDVIAVVNNSSVIDTASATVNANNKAKVINVAGSVSVGGKAMGLALAYNALNSNTGAYVENSTVKNEDGTADITVSAANHADLYAIGAGVGVSTDTVAANGSVGINRGHSDVEAAITNAILSDVCNLQVDSADATKLIAVGGGITLGKGIAVGGAVAYNQIGDFFTSQDSTDENNNIITTVLSDNQEQVNRAAIIGSTITTNEDGRIKVSASDRADMTTIAIGVGISGSGAGVAVQGAAATAILDKTTSAEIIATNIDTTGNKNSDVEVSASTDNTFITTADVIAGTQNVVVGAGVTVNQLTADTKAVVSGGTYDVGNMHVKANSVADITNVGIGAAASGNVAVGGSVAVNIIDNDTMAELGSDDENVTTNVTATGNVGVTADSYEVLKNYVGQLSVTAGGYVGAGASVAYNEIVGDTKANVKNSTLKAATDSSKAIKVKKRNRNAKDDRNELTFEELTGLVVAADSEHKLDNVVVTGSVAAGSAAGVAVSGTVDVNSFEGETVAIVSASDVNKDVANNAAGNVTVMANDSTDVFSSGSSGSVGVAGSAGVAVGGAADTNSLNRDVTASIVAKDRTSANRKSVNANKMNVTALNKHFITTNANGLSVAVSAAGTAGAAASIAVTEVGAKTIAKIDNIQSQNNGLKLDAHHYNDTDVIIAAAAVTASIGGGNAGMGIAVLNDNSDTQAIFTNNDVDSYIVDGEDSGKVEVLASNHNELNTTIVGASVAASIGAGAGGTVTVNNMESIVKATVAGSKINIDADDSLTKRNVNDVSVKAENKIATKLNFNQAAGGFVGLAAGVGVNTVDTTVLTEVSGSEIVAKDVRVIALEDRDIEQSSLGVAVGGGALTANILISSIGTKATETYGDLENTYGDDKKKAEANINEALERANNAKAAQYEQIRADNLLKGNIGKDATLPNAQAKGGGSETAEGVVTKISNSFISASNEVEVKADAVTNATIHSLQGAVAITGVINTTVAVLNVDRKNTVTIDGTTIFGDDLLITSEQEGTSEIKAVQAGGAVDGAFNIAYSGANVSGANKVNVQDSKLAATNELDLNAIDNSSMNVRTIGAAAGAVFAGGALIANSDNTSDNEIVIKNTDNAQNYFEGTTIDVIATKNNTSNVEIIGGAVGAMALNGLVAIAKDSGDNRISISGNNAFGGNANITAMSNPAVKAKAEAYSGTLLGAGGASVATAEATGVVETLVNGTNTFVGDNVTINASVSQQTDDKDNAVENVNAVAIGNSAAIGGAVNANVATAKSTMTVNVDVDSATYDGVDKLTIQGLNAAKIAAEAFGVTISGYFASGNNVTDTVATLNTTVNARGNSGILGDALIKADSFVDVNNKVNGYGGAILLDVSPLAAWAKNSVTTNTAVNISGGWNLDGEFITRALNSDNVLVHADSVKAATVGGSGTLIDNAINHTANNNVSGAVTSKGKQSYITGNVINHDVDLDGSGYGGLNVVASDMNNDIISTAKVNVNNATLKGTGDEGSIEAVAYTEGNADYDNLLKAAGVIPVAVADSDHKITYNNEVNIDDATTITTAKKYQDITLAAYDDSIVNLFSTADTQGGVVGAASATTSNTFTRSNKINVNSGTNIESTNDVNLYAGAQGNGIASNLMYNIVADAYNKTVVPVCINPDIDNNMSQSNVVNVGGNVESVRHVNIKANKGYTDVVESAREYNFYTGDSGSASITSTAAGENNRNETHNNVINVSGNVKAGTHNSLDLIISGDVVINNPTGENPEDVGNATINYDSIIKTVGSGQGEWFDIKTVTTDAVKITNGLVPRYNEVVELLKEYASTSEEYVLYANELARLKAQMKDNGFTVTKDNKTYILESVIVPAVALPDIVVSGGDIVMDVDKYNVTGKLVAHGAENMNITNTSNLYLKVNDLVIGSVGGNIYHNDVLVDNVENHITSIVGSNQEPTITVKSVGGINAVSKADIGIFGDIVNSAGSVVIENANHNINVDGAAKITARNITLRADSGSVTQNSDGLLLVGGDPITKYQFSEKVAKKIQEYISEQLTKEEKLPSFADYEEYKAWLKNTVKISDADLVYTIDESAGIIAGENIYLSGLNVNIDGLVQSGYQNYSVVLNDNAKSKVEALDEEWSKYGKTLDDASVIGNEKYRVNTGGAVYNSSTKVYDYEVRVYYNPSTKQLLTEEIAPGGGSIYITGAISSTGSGRIRAMDGTADISINTLNVERDLAVNAITAQNVSGLISIKDTQTNTLTEFKNGSTTVTALKNGVSTEGRYTIDGDNIYYNPQAGLTVSWTGGISGSQTIENKSYKEKFVMWGLIDYDKTKDFVNHVTEKGGSIETISSSTIVGGDTLAQGVVIGAKDIGDNEYNVQGKYNVDSENTSYSPVTVDKEYSNTPLGEIFGYGYCTYMWTETTGTSTTSTYTIKADKPIDIGFMKDGKGTINIQAANNVLLEGNVSNAIDTDKNSIGSVNIYSNAGNVISVGDAHINSDKFVVDAYSGIKINHSAIGKTAVAKLNTVKNNIDINSSYGSVQFDGNLNLQDNPVRGSQAVRFALRNSTSTMGSQDGDFYYISEGDIDFGDTVLVGQRIDLISTTGSINAIVAPGTEVNSSDTLSASVNVSAYGDITLTNTNGDMRVGHIESAAGNVTLNTSGSFIDAVGDASLSDADSKLDRWIALGLINTQDAASEKANAASASKAERLDAITDRAEAIGFTGYADAASAYYGDDTIAAAKEVYINALKNAGGDTEKVNTAYATYQQAQAGYFEGKGYTAEQQAIIADYAEINNSSAYGWSANDLLYAIQDSVLNSEPGQVVTVGKANVSGVNVTLNAANGAIGIDGAEIKINNADMSKLDNLKILAQAKAGDLTWSADGVTVRQQKPLTVDASGEITLDSSKNVYLAGVRDTALDISGSIVAGNGYDVKLMSDKGITMVTGSITANNLIAYGGTGDIGSLDNMLTTYLTGAIDVNTSGSAYINQLGNNDLIVQAVAVGDTAVIKAVKDIVMSTVEGKDSGYINAKNLNLSSHEGSIGLENDGIRILNNGVVVNASVAGDNDIHLQGIGTGSMVIEEVTANEFMIASEGSIDLGVEASDNTTGIESEIDVDEDAILKAFGDINLNVGILNTKELVLETTNGAVIQKANHKLVVDNLVVKAVNGIDLNSGAETDAKLYNELNNVTLTNNGGDVVVGNASDKDLNVTINSDGTVNGGNITIKHYKGNGKNKINVQNNINASGFINLVNIGGGITAQAINSGKYVDIKADGDVETKDITATDNVEVAVVTGKIEVNGNVKAAENIVVKTEQGPITLNGSVTSEVGSIELRTNDQKDYSDIIINGEVVTESAGEQGSITIVTNMGNVHVNDNVIANGSAMIVINTMDGAITSPRKDQGETDDEVAIKSLNGSVQVEAKVNGDIDLYEVLAGNEASVVANSGNVSLYQINGQVVALQTKEENAKLTVDNAVVGEILKVKSFDSKIGSIEQRQGASSTLNVELASGDYNKPINGIELAFGEMSSGVTFDQLWTNKATISVASGELHLPKLSVLDEATFIASGYETTVYGTPPVRNDSNSIYWYNVVKNNPADNIEAWYDNNAKDNWMNLYFDADGATQHSNGVLLYLDNYYYVYDQRFTAVDYLNERLTRNANEVYVKTFTPDVSFYRRYGLYDLPKYDYAEAGEEDIIVETM